MRPGAPKAIAARLAPGDWQGLAAEPWIITPAVSTHHALATQLFETHGIKPGRHVEADHEAVISSLVGAGLGVALMREDVAIAEAAKGTLVIVGDTRLTTQLAFIYRKDRGHDPAIRAIAHVVQQVFAVEVLEEVAA